MITWRYFIKTGIALLLVPLAAVHAADAPKPGRPNVLFLMADDWSSPHAGVLGDPVVKTPTFDRVAREGVLFHNAYVSSPSCTPSRLAVATGQWHWRLEDGANLGGSLREGVPVYPELMQAAGYQIGFARKGAAPSDYKYTHRDPFGPRFKTFEEFVAQRKAGTPFCFWYGAGEPHRPYRYEEGRKDGMDPAKVKLPACLPDNETSRNDFCDYLHRVQQYDSDCARMLALLEKSGELENTIVVMSGDNGLPFPRCKATLYDTGTHVPLAIRWGAKARGGRTIQDFVSLTDLAPTFLEACGLPVPKDMTGRSLMPLLISNRDGQIDPQRDHVLTGMERHVYPYPSRAIRTADFLYIRNFNPANWPTGAQEGRPEPVDFAKTPWPTGPGAFSHNVDPSPSKQWMLVNPGPLNAQAFGPRPEEELYDLKRDPDQLRNVAADPAHAETRRRLAEQLARELRGSGDPRVAGAREARGISGWTVHVSRDLLAEEPGAMALAFNLLNPQLEEIVGVLPPQAVEELRKVPLYFSPEYPGATPAAEFHPDAGWLRDNGRDPEMAKGIEFTNIRIFEREVNRMPNFVLHELAHPLFIRRLALLRSPW